jgi:hypothetical protein
MNPPRERKFALYDQKKSIVNYMKLNDEDEVKVSMIKRLTEMDKNIDINQILNDEKQKNSEGELPKPPTHSNDKKIYQNEDKLFIHQRAAIINSFDPFQTLDSELSLINLENYLSKFDEDELAQLSIKDILTFDISEFDTLKNKMESLREMGIKLNDSELGEFLNMKIKSIEENKRNIEILINNLDKVEDFIILNETLKFFLKNKKK